MPLYFWYISYNHYHHRTRCNVDSIFWTMEPSDAMLESVGLLVHRSPYRMAKKRNDNCAPTRSKHCQKLQTSFQSNYCVCSFRSVSLYLFYILTLYQTRLPYLPPIHSMVLKFRVRHFSCRTLQSYNSPGDWARELFEPSTDSASLVGKIEKTLFCFGGFFLEVTSQRGHVLEKQATFGLRLAPTHWPILYSQSGVEN